MAEPLILVDVDGVIAPLAGMPDARTEHHRRVRVCGYSLILDRRHRRWLGELGARAECTWSSYWQRDAPLVGAALGVGADWASLEFDRFNERLERARLTARDPAGKVWTARVPRFKMPLIQHAAQDRPVAIVDDVLSADPQVKNWARARSRAGTETLLIAPYAEIGLERRHVDEVYLWLDLLGLSGSTAA